MRAKERIDQEIALSANKQETKSFELNVHFILIKLYFSIIIFSSLYFNSFNIVWNWEFIYMFKGTTDEKFNFNGDELEGYYATSLEYRNIP